MSIRQTLKTHIMSSIELTVIGKPFVPHVNQLLKPTLNIKDFLKKAYVRHYTNNEHLIRYGYYKLMGYIYDFKPYLKKYLYLQYGSWSEAYAPNQTILRKVIYGGIDKIIELK